MSGSSKEYAPCRGRVEGGRGLVRVRRHGCKPQGEGERPSCKQDPSFLRHSLKERGLQFTGDCRVVRALAFNYTSQFRFIVMLAGLIVECY